MSIKSNLEKHTVSWLKRQDTDGKAQQEYFYPTQRGVGCREKSNLIVSLLMDIPIENVRGDRRRQP